MSILKLQSVTVHVGMGGCKTEEANVVKCKQLGICISFAIQKLWKKHTSSEWLILSETTDQMSQTDINMCVHTYTHI